MQHLVLPFVKYTKMKHYCSYSYIIVIFDYVPD